MQKLRWVFAGESMDDNLLRLDVGCGREPLEGYLGVDIASEVQPDLCASMWAIPLPDASVAEIYSSHALEHIAKAQVVPTLQEWKRLLIPGGFIILLVPDLIWCCENWLEHQTNDWHMDTLFGNQEHIGEFHKTGFTVRIMQDYAAQAGLTIYHHKAIWSHEQSTLWFGMK